jgi:glycosyltransferase involved in cell wall biosynthesis
MVVYGGKIAEQDGADILIQVAHRIINELNRHDILFVVLGDGPALSSVKQLAADLKIEKWIHFGGWVARSELIKYMKSADVCISPEPSSPLNDKSTFVKVIEYVASGKPIVAFALQETMITAGDAAIYANIDSIDELAGNLVKVLDNPQRQIIMQRVALKRRKMLSWENSEKVFLSAYDGLLLKQDEFDDFHGQHGWDLLSMPELEAMKTTEEIHS